MLENIEVYNINLSIPSDQIQSIGERKGLKTYPQEEQWPLHDGNQPLKRRQKEAKKLTLEAEEVPVIAQSQRDFGS